MSSSVRRTTSLAVQLLGGRFLVPAIFSMAANVNMLDLELRHWEYNHCEHFPERVTCTCDGEPQVVCCPHNRFLQRLLKSGKYKQYVVMGETGGECRLRRERLSSGVRGSAYWDAPRLAETHGKLAAACEDTAMGVLA